MLSGGSACGHKSHEPGSGLLRPTVQRRNLELQVGDGHLVVPSKPISGETATTQQVKWTRSCDKDFNRFLLTWPQNLRS